MCCAMCGQAVREFSEIERDHKPLYRAYLLKEALCQALYRKPPWWARRDRAVTGATFTGEDQHQRTSTTLLACTPVSVSRRMM